MPTKTMYAIEEARRELSGRILTARTLPEIRSARNALRQWLASHPDEQGMRDGFEQLAQMEEILTEHAELLPSSGSATPPDNGSATHLQK
jgi:hypothetical protein